jgi:hypothetical protein
MPVGSKGEKRPADVSARAVMITKTVSASSTDEVANVQLPGPACQESKLVVDWA